MRKSETSNPNDGPSFQAPRYRPNWIAALLCFFLGAYLAVALIAYDPKQSPFDHKPVPAEQNPAGQIGAYAAAGMFRVIGVSAWFVPIFLLWMLAVSVRNSKHMTGTRTIAMLIAIVASSGLAAMFVELKWVTNWFPYGPGGLVGQTLYYRFLRGGLGPFGAGLILGTVYLGALLFIFMRDIAGELEKIFTNFSGWRADRAKAKAELEEARRKEKEAKAKQKSAAATVAATVAAAAARAGQSTPTTPTTPVGPTGKKSIVPKSGEDPLAKAPAARAVTPGPAASDPAKLVKPAVAAPPPPPAAKSEPKPALPPKPANGKPALGETATDTKSLAVGAAGKVELNIVKPEEPKKAAKITLPQSDDANYQFPPLSLLKEQVKPASSNSEEEHRQNAENLLRILSEFGVEVTLGEIHVGPVITRYEVVPAAGVRVEKIAGLDKNIALGMRAQSVRILAPIPG